MQGKLLIFDLDGTLVDSGSTVLSILNEMRLDRSMPPMTIEALVPTLSLGGIEMVRATLNISEHDDADHVLNDFRARYRNLPTPADSVYPGVREVLNRLRSDGYNLCICTNKPRDLAYKVLKETELASSFEFVISGGDLPSRKPDPAFIDTCLKHFEIPPDQTLLIGDSLVDQQLSANAHIQFIFYAGGYNDGVDESALAGKFYNYQHLPPVICSL